MNISGCVRMCVCVFLLKSIECYDSSSQTEPEKIEEKYLNNHKIGNKRNLTVLQYKHK